MINYISKLITRYFNGRHDPDTEIEIQQWLVDGKYSAEKEETLSRIWGQIGGKADKSVYRSLKEVNGKIGLKASPNWFLRYALPRVAAVLMPLLVLVGAWIYQTAPVGIVEVATLAGEQRNVRLPDGSDVWLNACSKISYPEKFNDATRRVTLSGEAYFSVVRNEQKPFEVATKELTVEVLGTQFNVKAYPDDGRVTTTLASGKVAVLLPEEKYTLRPGQKLVYNTADKSADIRGASDTSANWRDGSLIFTELTMSEIFKELERRFNVKFDYSQCTLPDDRYSVKFTNKEELPQILNVFQDVTGGGFAFAIKGRTIIITIK